MALNEDWYPQKDQEALRRAALAAGGAAGLCIELGSWEGRSALVIANALLDRAIYCVDRWQVPYEGVTRDVEASFDLNTQDTINIVKVKSDVLAYCRDLAARDVRLAFAHIDAAHDYNHVADTILTLKPLCSPGAVLCGHDYRNAPGVFRAVRELLPGHEADGQLWYWRA